MKLNGKNEYQLVYTNVFANTKLYSPSADHEWQNKMNKENLEKPKRVDKDSNILTPLDIPEIETAIRGLKIKNSRAREFTN